jgi:hypothetical protein
MSEQRLDAYANWIRNNQNLAGTPEFYRVAQAYRELRSTPAQETQPASSDEQTIGQALGRAYENVGTSAAEFGRNVIQPFIAPVETAQAIGQIGRGLYSKAQGALGVQQDPAQKAMNEAAANAVGQMYADRYGSMARIKETLATDPVGLLSDAASVLTLGGAAGARAPGIVGQAARGVRNVGTAIDPLTIAARPVAAAGRYVAEPIASNVLAATTGTSPEAIRTAARSGMEGNQAFTSAMRETVAPEDVVTTARRALDQMKADRSAAYTSGMVPVKADRAVLDTVPVFDAVSDAQSVFTKGGFVKNREAAGVWQNISDTVQDFATNPSVRGTPDDFDALKQAVGEIRNGTQQGSQARLVADRVYNSIKDQISKQAPAYEKTMRDYSEASKQLSEISKTFSLGEKASTDTALRKLQSIMRNNVNTNYGARAKLADVLAQYEPNLPAMIAGQTMSAGLPRGLGRAAAVAQSSIGALLGLGGAISPAALAGLAPLLAASSPRLVGEAAYASGRARGLLGAAGVTPANAAIAGRAGFQAGRAEEELERRGLLGQ